MNEKDLAGRERALARVSREASEPSLTAPRSYARVGDIKHDAVVVLSRVWRQLFERAIDANHDADARSAVAYLEACRQVENAVNDITRRDSAESLRTTREHVIKNWTLR